MENVILNVLNNVKGCKFVGVDYFASVQMKVTNNPLRDSIVMKRTQTTFQYNYRYENAVKNRAAEGVEFKAAAVSGYDIIRENCIYRSQKTGKLQARFYCHKNAVTKVTYYVDGLEATKDEVAIIKTFQRGNYVSTKQSAVGITEADQVQPRNIVIENIISLRVDGEEYVNPTFANIVANINAEETAVAE